MLSDPYPVSPFICPAHATVALPGSKSITNRALLLAALSGGETAISGALFSEDTALMAAALRQLGFSVVEDPEHEIIRVGGRGGEIPVREADLFVGLSGTSARFLTALCCLAPGGRFRIDGVPQMRRRPIEGLLAALESLGARIRSDHGHFPIEIESHGLSGGTVTLDARESSQLLSALLMVAPLASDAVRIELSDPGYRREYVTMTLRMMQQFGQPLARISADGRRVDPPARSPYRKDGHAYAVEADASAASYFLALPCATGGVVRLPGLHAPSLQGDAAFAEVLVRIGADVQTGEDGTVCQVAPGTPAGNGLREDFHAISDTFLTMAAIAPLLEGPTHLSGLAHTRRQETDRIAAMATELRRLGQEVEEEPDAITIHPRPLRAGEVDTHGDHRVAMSFAILGCHDLNRNGQPWLRIRQPGVCAKTFPRFFETLEAARQESLTAAGLPQHLESS